MHDSHSTIGTARGTGESFVRTRTFEVLSRVAECEDLLGMHAREDVISKCRLTLTCFVVVVRELFGLDRHARPRFKRGGDLTMKLAPLSSEQIREHALTG